MQLCCPSADDINTLATYSGCRTMEGCSQVSVLLQKGSKERIQLQLVYLLNLIEVEWKVLAIDTITKQEEESLLIFKLDDDRKR